LEPTNPFAAPQSGSVASGDAAKQQDPKYRRIGGWLVLLALLLCLNTVIGVMCFTGSLQPTIAWLSVRTFFNAGLCIASPLGLAIMFRRSHVFPTYMGGYLLGCLLFALYFAVVNGFGPDRWPPLGRPLVECSIWNTYLIRSRRVRLTFVR
jgi:hypothetical protein